jgi:hypothetical protein
MMMSRGSRAGNIRKASAWPKGRQLVIGCFNQNVLTRCVVENRLGVPAPFYRQRETNWQYQIIEMRWVDPGASREYRDAKAKF